MLGLMANDATLITVAPTGAEADKAADWLARCAVINYPESEFAQLWLMLATVSGGAIPFGSR